MGLGLSSNQWPGFAVGGWSDPDPDSGSPYHKWPVASAIYTFKGLSRRSFLR